MSIALDIGTRHMRSLRREGERLVGRRNHAVYLSLPDRPIQRRLLEKASIRFATCADSLLVVGMSALEAAEMLQAPSIPLLINSRVPEADPVGRQVLTSLIDCLLPHAKSPGENCWANIPGAIHKESAEELFFTQLIRLKGYQPRFVPAGMAVILSELSDNGFTGIGCDFGAGLTRVSVAHHAVELASVCLRKGGDWIDSRVAESEGCILWDSEGHQYLNSTAISRWKESNLISVVNPISEREQRLSLLCEELIAEMLHRLERQLEGRKQCAAIRQPLPIVCSGGLSRLPGFPELLLEMTHDVPLSLEISEVRAGSDTDYGVARGCLILAELNDGTPHKSVA